MNRVQYIDVGAPVKVGSRAAVKPYDHPNDVLNREWVLTSEVQHVIDGLKGPIFRTKNTIYRPADDYEALPIGKVHFCNFVKVTTPLIPFEVV